MNILIVFTYDYSLKTWYESQVLNRELSIYKEINSINNFKFTLLTYGDETDLDIDIDNDIFEVVPIYKYFKYKKNKYLRFLYSFLIPFKLKDLVQNISLIKQHQILGIWVSVILKILLSNKPLFVRTGYDMHKFSLQDKKILPIRFFYKVLNFTGVFFSNTYSVSNEEDFQDLSNKFIKPSILIKRPNWVLGNYINNFENRYDRKILFVGRLEYQKNIKELLSNFSNTEFEIVIYGEGTLKKELELFAEKNNVNAIFMGNISNDKLYEKYNDFKFFVSASLFEGNPKTVLEAMSCGCVVFASDIPAHTEIIKHLDTGLIYNSNKTSLIDAFRKIYKNNQELLKISSNAVNDINEKYGLEVSAKREINDYKRLIRF